MASKRYYDFQLQLEIDGNFYPAEKVLIVSTQSLPRWASISLCCLSKRLGKFFDAMPLGRREDVSDEEASALLLSLEMCWARNVEEMDVRLEYFLNSVQEIVFDGERIKFSGICSPVVR